MAFPCGGLGWLCAPALDTRMDRTARKAPAVRCGGSGRAKREGVAPPIPGGRARNIQAPGGRPLATGLPLPAAAAPRPQGRLLSLAGAVNDGLSRVARARPARGSAPACLGLAGGDIGCRTL